MIYFRLIGFILLYHIIPIVSKVKKSIFNASNNEMNRNLMNTLDIVKTEELKMNIMLNYKESSKNSREILFKILLKQNDKEKFEYLKIFLKETDIHVIRLNKQDIITIMLNMKEGKYKLKIIQLLIEMDQEIIMDSTNIILQNILQLNIQSNEIILILKLLHSLNNNIFIQYKQEIINIFKQKTMADQFQIVRIFKETNDTIINLLFIDIFDILSKHKGVYIQSKLANFLETVDIHVLERNILNIIKIMLNMDNHMNITTFFKIILERNDKLFTKYSYQIITMILSIKDTKTTGFIMEFLKHIKNYGLLMEMNQKRIITILGMLNEKELNEMLKELSFSNFSFKETKPMCAFCYLKFNDDDKQLNICRNNHNVHENCMKEIVDTKRKKCTLCREKIIQFKNDS